MIRYTLDDPELIFNPGRQASFLALIRTLRDLSGKKHVTELSFRDKWLDLSTESGTVFENGWYAPPPRGTAVLFGERLNFDSLRNRQNWSGDTMIDWDNGSLYAYSSAVDRQTGRMGDLSVTLNWGSNHKTADHIRNCHEAVLCLFSRMESVCTAADLFRLSGEVFKSHHLLSTVISRTDNLPSNLGHTFESIPVRHDAPDLTEEERTALSGKRRFLNSGAEWSFEPGLQFTVEPQLISETDSSLPKITQHYLVQARSDGFCVCNDIDFLLSQYGLS